MSDFESVAVAIGGQLQGCDGVVVVAVFQLVNNISSDYLTVAKWLSIELGYHSYLEICLTVKELQHSGGSGLIFLLGRNARKSPEGG